MPPFPTLFPIGCAVLLLTGVLGFPQAPRELKVGVLAPLTGNYSAVGTFERDGALLAIGEWNARGGVLGMKITPIVEDSGDNPTSARRAASAAVNADKVRYIVGDAYSFASIAESEITGPARVLQVTPSSTVVGVTVSQAGAVKPYVFRACFSDPFQGRASAAFAAGTLKAKRAFVASDPSDAYSSGLAGEFGSAFTNLGGKVAGTGTFSGYDTDFSRLLEELKRAAFDVVFFPAIRYETVNAALRQAREMGVMAPFLGGDAWDTPQLDMEALDGCYYTTHFWAEDQRPEVRRFLKAYGDTYQDSAGSPLTPDFVATLAYDAMNLLLTAIKTAGADDTDKVKAAMERISFDSVTDRITMDAQHNAVKSVAVIHITGGKFVLDSLVSP